MRTTAAEVKKKINFETRGNDTLIDRKILDQLSEPLMHMVRNAVDHGVESTDARLSANKSAEGQVTLDAFYRAGEVFVQLTDDGVGRNETAHRHYELCVTVSQRSAERLAGCTP